MKYNDWNYEEECSNFDKSNSELFEELDEMDLKRYLSFLSNAIGCLKDEFDYLTDQQ